MAKQDDRFIKVLNEGSTWTTNREIWVDKTTGVNYLWVASGYAGGLTPLLDANGHPVVTRIPLEEEWRRYYSGLDCRRNIFIRQTFSAHKHTEK